MPVREYVTDSLFVAVCYQPVPTGLSMYKTECCLLQEDSRLSNVRLLPTMKGPFSKNSDPNDDPPGPPSSHKITGAVSLLTFMKQYMIE